MSINMDLNDMYLILRVLETVNHGLVNRNNTVFVFKPHFVAQHFCFRLYRKYEEEAHHIGWFVENCNMEG